jgi:hypothetical protein
MFCLIGHYRVKKFFQKNRLYFVVYPEKLSLYEISEIVLYLIKNQNYKNDPNKKAKKINVLISKSFLFFTKMTVF